MSSVVAPWGTAYADRAGDGRQDCSVLEVEAEVHEGKSRDLVREAICESRDEASFPRSSHGEHAIHLLL